MAAHFAFFFTSCVVMLAFWSPSTAAHFAFCLTSWDYKWSRDPGWGWSAARVFWTPSGLFCWPFWGSGPGVGLALCCFVVYSVGQFVLSLAFCFVFVFFGPFSIVFTSLGKE